MKKIIIFLLVSLLFITNVYAEGSVEIKSIDLDSKSETTTELNRPKFNGLEMNYDLRFKNVNDFAKYKIVIKNNTNKDYKVSEDTSFRVSDYVTYKYEASKTISANSETTVNIIITYSNGVESTTFENGVFNESNKAVLELRDEEGNIVNPKTGSFNKVLILGVVAIVSTIALIFFMNKKSAFFVLVIFLILSPVILKATEELKVTMNVKVQISIRPTYKVYYKVEEIMLKYNNDEFDIFGKERSSNYIYLGSISDENKYEIGSKLADKTSYEEGDTIILKKIESKKMPSLSDEDYNNPSIYERLDDASILYNVNIETVVYDKWYYKMSDQITQLETDYDTMRFDVNSIISNRWENEHLLFISAPTKFTMPAHDVLFDYDNIETALPNYPK